VLARGDAAMAASICTELSDIVERLLEQLPRPLASHATRLVDEQYQRARARQRGVAVAELPDEFVFVSAGVGDCKAYLYSARDGSARDITRGNRSNQTDASDPGGRLGPYRNDGEPDLRNLDVFCTLCERDDLIWIVSDGVHDNLDAQTMGLTPTQCGLDGVDAWTDGDPVDVEHVKAAYAQRYLNEQLLQPLARQADGGRLTPRLVGERLVRHAVETTDTARSEMERIPEKRLPKDYALFPGKLDHVSCAVFRVQPFPADEHDQLINGVVDQDFEHRANNSACSDLENCQICP
jgi:hypothetical protein